MAREFENGIVVAVDARDGFVATEGWAEKSDMPVIDLARRFDAASAQLGEPPTYISLRARF